MRANMMRANILPFAPARLDMLEMRSRGLIGRGGLNSPNADTPSRLGKTFKNQ